ncbi:MAG: protein phosphatase 2C domain-containing protein [Candidatus Margulisbacteria bacterium]|nr:protein phosphatase 2C domain-containing protein [Candidatus Margulisiibacteriota bacterium]
MVFEIKLISSALLSKKHATDDSKNIDRFRRLVKEGLPKLSCQKTLQSLATNVFLPIADGKTDCDQKTLTLATQALLKINRIKDKPLENPNQLKWEIVTGPGNKFAEITRFADRGVYGASDIGQMDKQDDSLAAVILPDGRIRLTGADGMGGHADGYVASGLAVSAVDGKNDVQTAVVKAHEKINKTAGPAKGQARMGTTIAAVEIEPSSGTVKGAWIGDSRVYLMKGNGDFYLLTMPHTRILGGETLGPILNDASYYFFYSLYPELKDNKEKTEEKVSELKGLLAAVQPLSEREIILIDELTERARKNASALLYHHPKYALGHALPDGNTVPGFAAQLEKDDVLLVVSDGMSLAPEEIRQEFGQGRALPETVKALIEASKKKNGDGSDNITVLAFKQPAPVEAKAASVYEELEPESINLSDLAFLKGMDKDAKIRGDILIALLANNLAKNDLVGAIADSSVILDDLPLNAIVAAYNMILKARETPVRNQALINLKVTYYTRVPDQFELVLDKIIAEDQAACSEYFEGDDRKIIESFANDAGHPLKPKATDALHKLNAFAVHERATMIFERKPLPAFELEELAEPAESGRRTTLPPEPKILTAREALDRLQAIQAELFNEETPVSLDRLLELNEQAAEISKQITGNAKMSSLATFTLVRINEEIERLGEA